MPSLRPESFVLSPFRLGNCSSPARGGTGGLERIKKCAASPVAPPEFPIAGKLKIAELASPRFFSRRGDEYVNRMETYA